MAEYPWPYPKPITDAGESMRVTMATDPRDWSKYKRDAWLWGIVFGWESCWDNVAKQHGWDKANTERLKKLHEQFLDKFPKWWKEKGED